MAVHIHPLDIPSRYYKSIGQIIVGWNLTEALIASIIWKLHRIKDVRKGRALIYGLQAGSKLKILAQSAKLFSKTPAMQQQLTQLIGRANTLKDERNLLAHGLWGHMPKEKPKLWKVFKMDALDHGLLLIRKKVTAELDPARIAKEIRTLNSDFKKFMALYRIPPP